MAVTTTSGQGWSGVVRSGRPPLTTVVYVGSPKWSADQLGLTTTTDHPYNHTLRGSGVAQGIRVARLQNVDLFVRKVPMLGP